MRFEDSSGKLQILLVDDEPGVTDSIRTFFEEHLACEIFSASNGVDAVEMLQKNNAWVKYTFNKPQRVDILKFTGTDTRKLLANVPIEPGEYKEMRLFVSKTPMDNFVELTAEPSGTAVEASMAISERTQRLLDAVWTQVE